MSTRSQSALAARPGSSQSLDSLDAGHQIAVREFQAVFTKAVNAKELVVGFTDPTSTSLRVSLSALSDVLVSGTRDPSPPVVF